MIHQFAQRKGQAITEVIIALTISGIIVAAVAATIAVSLRSTSEAQSQQTVLQLMQEYISDVTIIADGSWATIYNLDPKGATSSYYITASGTQLGVASGTASSTINDEVYTRYFSVENVSRDGSGDIESTYNAANDDPSTQKITVHVEWGGQGGARSQELSTYVTRWRNRSFVQSDWSGGPGAADPVTGATNMFTTSTYMDVSSSTGSIILDGY